MITLNLIWSELIWCDLMWSDLIWSNLIWSDMIWWLKNCVLIWSDLIWFNLIWSNFMMWFDAMWYVVIWCWVIWCDSMWSDMIWSDVMWHYVWCELSLPHLISLDRFGKFWCDDLMRSDIYATWRNDSICLPRLGLVLCDVIFCSKFHHNSNELTSN